MIGAIVWTAPPIRKDVWTKPMSPQPTMSGKSAKRHRRSGMTLVEVVIAMALFALASAGIYAAGIAALRLTQTNRLMTEAHAFTKQGIEFVIGAGYDAVRGGAVPPATNFVDTLTHSATIVRTMEAIWHASDSSVVTNSVADGYGEIYVHASFLVPGTSRTVTNTLSTVIMNTSTP